MIKPRSVKLVHVVTSVAGVSQKTVSFTVRTSQPSPQVNLSLRSGRYQFAFFSL